MDLGWFASIFQASRNSSPPSDGPDQETMKSEESSLSEPVS